MIYEKREREGRRGRVVGACAVGFELADGGMPRPFQARVEDPTSPAWEETSIGRDVIEVLGLACFRLQAVLDSDAMRAMLSDLDTVDQARTRSVVDQACHRSSPDDRSDM